MTKYARRLALLAGLALMMFALPACDEDSTDPGGGNNDTTPPTVTGMSPSNGESDVSDSQDILVTFNEPMDPASDDGNVTLSHGTITGQAWTDSRNLTISHTDWPEATEVTVTLGTGFADAAGNDLAAAYSASFWTESSVVAFLESNPPDGATGINRDASITLLFSEDMNETSMATGITISDGIKALFDFEVSEGDGNWYTLDPTDRLPASSTIYVNITTDVQASGGRNLAEGVVIDFETGTDIDETPPTILGFDPPDGGTMPVDQGYVRVTFSEPMDTSSLEPVSMNGQFLWMMSQSMTEPTWNGDNTEVTVAMPLGLPAGLPLEITFGGYADANGVVQTAETSWSATTPGTADYYPAVDGAELTFRGEWARGNLGETEPAEGGEAEQYLKLAARATAGDWNVWSYADPDFLVPDEYEIFRAGAGGILWLGFANNIGPGAKVLEEVLFASPLKIVDYPLAAANTWTSSSSVTFSEGTFFAVMDGTTIGKADLVIPFFDEGMEVYWSDVWSVRTELDVSVGGETIITEDRTIWYAPGIGIVKQTLREENLDPEDDPGWEETEFWLAPPDRGPAGSGS